MKKFNLAAGILLVVLLTASASAQEYNCPMGGMMYGSYGSGAMIFSWLFGLLVIALIIAAIYWLVKSANRKK